MQRGFGQEAEVAEHSTEFASRAALLAERIGQLFLADDLLLNQQLTQANSASPGHKVGAAQRLSGGLVRDRKSTRLNSSHDQISYAVFCLKKKKKKHHYSFSTELNPQPIYMAATC